MLGFPARDAFACPRARHHRRRRCRRAQRSDIPEDHAGLIPVPPESMLRMVPRRCVSGSTPWRTDPRLPAPKKKISRATRRRSARVSFPFPRRDDECARNPDRAPARPSRRVSLATHPLTRSFPFFPFLSSLARADVLGAFLLGAYGEDCARGHRGDGCDARRASPRARHPGLRRQRRHGHRRRHPAASSSAPPPVAEMRFRPPRRPSRKPRRRRGGGAAAVVSEDRSSPSRMSRRWTPKRWRFNFWMRFRRGRRHSRRAFRRRRSWR